MLRRKPLLLPLPFLCPLFSTSCRRNPSPPLPPLNPPSPKKIPFAVSAHGKTWDDPYRWMSRTDDPDLVRHLQRENAYAEAFMADAEGLRRRLVAELRARMPPRVSTPPESWGDWFYYQYIPEGKEYPILCRRAKHHKSFVKAVFNYLGGFEDEEILLDWNEIAEQLGYVHVGTCRISPDHKYLAYTLDADGSEMFVLLVKDLQTGQIISKSGVKGIVSLAWALDSNCLLYTVCDESLRPYRVFCTKLGSNMEDDLLFTENNLSCSVDITSTKDGRFITINSNSRASSEVYVMDAANLKDGLWPVRERVPSVQYFLEHHYGVFYILTNAPAENIGSVTGGYYLARCSADKSMLANWQVIILPDQDMNFVDMDIFHGHLVLSVQKKGLSTFCSINLPIDANVERPVTVMDLDPWIFPLPSSFCNIVPGSNHDFTSSIYHVVVSSPVMPDLLVAYDMTKQNFNILHQEEVAGITYDKEANKEDQNMHSDLSIAEYHVDKHLEDVDDLQKWSDLSETLSCERVEVSSHDGVKVPLTILYSKKAHCIGQSPGVLHGYGAYGEVLDKSWSSDLLSLLNRGWVFAYADVRGGGGDSSWHQTGSGLYKLNSMHDFSACGSFLINNGFVHKDRLGAIGSSAGGLLVGSTVNMYPGLFCAAVLKVPFLDICNTMLNPSLPLTILDYEEFGDPKIKSLFETIRSYSPYDNIPSGVCYPSVLVTASLNDSSLCFARGLEAIKHFRSRDDVITRVGVWEAAKWVARVRENICPACSASVILKTNMSGGHFGEGGRFSHREDTAFEYAFLIKVMEGVLEDEKQSE